MTDLQHDVLEQRLRAACQAVIPHLTDEAVVNNSDVDTLEAGWLSTSEFGDVVHLDGMRSRSHRSRSAVAVGAAAAALVLTLGGLTLLQRGGTQTPTTAVTGVSDSSPPGATTAPAYVFETPTVSLQAASIEVISGDRTFSPTDARFVSDPGVANEYTTLELTWFQDGTEQRIDMYFRSDGTTWWAYEIRTYDVSQAPDVADVDWHEPIATGTYFTTALGSAFNGDLDLPDLRITGMTLQAFLTPDACRAPTSPTALVADYPEIDATVGGFGATLQIIDTATCTAMPIAPYTFEYTSDYPSIAAIGDLGWPAGIGSAATISTVPGIDNSSPPATVPTVTGTKTRVELQLLTPGQTTIRGIARDAAGTIVGSATMRVTVREAHPAPTVPAEQIISTTMSPSDAGSANVATTTQVDSQARAAG